jgi:transcription elongation factor GreA
VAYAGALSAPLPATEPSRGCETSGFASPPHDGFALISTPFIGSRPHVLNLTWTNRPVRAPYARGVSDAVVMTEADRRALEAELQVLETEGRAEIAERIRTARAWGDLKENSEYHDAKNSQAILETKILRLRDRLLRAEVVEAEPGSTVARFGSRLRLVDAASERELAYTLVSAVDADAAQGRLSVESPVGQALLGASAGDTVEIATPRGTRSLQVVSVG